jgi:hypothetical protein
VATLHDYEVEREIMSSKTVERLRIVIWDFVPLGAAVWLLASVWGWQLTVGVVLLVRFHKPWEKK